MGLKTYTGSIHQCSLIESSSSLRIFRIAPGSADSSSSRHPSSLTLHDDASRQLFMFVIALAFCRIRRMESAPRWSCEERCCGDFGFE